MPPTPAGHFSQAFAQYASLQRPPVGTALYDRVYNKELGLIKGQLKSMLDTDRLLNMPGCFPFHYFYDGNIQSAVISYDSYEFHERVSPPDQRSRPQTATFSFTARSRSQYLSWQITVPWRGSPSDVNIPPKICIAQVDVDPMIAKTSYWDIFMTNRRHLLTSLSLSIELGVLITITVADCKRPVIHPTNRNLNYKAGDIIFVVTDNNRGSEVVLVA